MLILGRKLGQRARIETPCGSFIWLTMGDRRVLADAPNFRVVNFEDGSVSVIIGEDMIRARYFDKTMHAGTRTYMNRHGMGIDAPREYSILREELIPA